MLYKEFQGNKISALGMGAMRLPVIEGDENRVDGETTAKMVDYAIKNGINYFDTAWGYHGGDSEVKLGEALKKYPRDSFYLADKFPGYDLSNMGKAKEIFEEQLKRCQVDYFDFYLIHNVCEMNIEQYLDDEKNHTVSDLLEEKKKGRIKHLGFSLHATYPNVRRFLEAYGEDMEFVQIQINYFDWNFQKAKDIVELVSEYKLPIIVMEPLRGGKLAKLEDQYEERLKKMRPEETTPAWAFRFLQSVPNVFCVLSGFSNMEQTEENIKTCSEYKPTTVKEDLELFAIVEDMLKEDTVPCTSCHYCTNYCPQKLNIPRLIELYNQKKVTKVDFIVPMALAAMPDDKKPAACITCRKCEEVCPQHIKVADVFADFAGKKLG